MTRCLEECGKQWRPVQGKLGWEKQKKEEAKEEAGRKREERDRKKKQKKGKTVEVKRIAEEWEIWDEKEEAEAKRLVPEKFHKWIKVFGKKQSERMLIRKVWDHMIDVKKGVGPHDRCKERVCTEKGKGVSVVKGGKGGGKRVC